MAALAAFNYAEMFDTGLDDTVYRKLDVGGVSELAVGDERFLKLEPEVLEQLAFEAFRDCQHLLRQPFAIASTCCGPATCSSSATFSTTPGRPTTTVTSLSPC
jgi:hypothetical protein